MARFQSWEDGLHRLFAEIDVILEERHGHRFVRHPARPERGRTAQPTMDGLFNVGAKYTAGFGSEHGEGYVIDVVVATLQPVDDAYRAELDEEVADLVTELLPKFFPGTDLRVVKDDTGHKIVGDLGLGER